MQKGGTFDSKGYDFYRNFPRKILCKISSCKAFCSHRFYMQDLQVFYGVSEPNHFTIHCIFDLGIGSVYFMITKQTPTFTAAETD